MEEVARRRSFYDSVMENPSSKKSYQLIRRSRSKNKSNATCIQVQDTKHFDPVQQRRCFEQYYEDLATPKDMNYDNVFWICLIYDMRTLSLSFTKSLRMF